MPTVSQRNLVVELAGTIVSMVLGAFIGSLANGNGLGYASFIVLCSSMGWVVWTRRKRSFLTTIGICVALAIVWWPIAIIFRELGRGL